MKRDAGDEVKILTQEQKTRCLDFAKRMVYKGYERLTQKRKDKLWGDVEWFLTDALEDGHWGWETGDREDTFSMADWIHERFEKYEYPSDKWERKICDLGEEPTYFRMLSATCRAAMDIIDDFAGGVWGWTVSDIRRMYDGTIPEWFPLDGWMILGNGVAPKLKDEDHIAL